MSFSQPTNGLRRLSLSRDWKRDRLRVPDQLSQRKQIKTESNVIVCHACDSAKIDVNALLSLEILAVQAKGDPRGHSRPDKDSSSEFDTRLQGRRSKHRTTGYNDKTQGK